jgi:hypothetical protein
MNHITCKPKHLDFEWGEFSISMKKALAQEREISRWIDQHPDTASVYWETRVSPCESTLLFRFSDPEIAVAFKMAFG